MAYGPVRFLYHNYVDSVEKITADTQAVGRGQLMELVNGSGSAIPLSVAPYTGTIDRTVTIVIDSIAAGTAVGQATYKYRFDDSSGWEATGVTTSATLTDLGMGIFVAWYSHATEADFALGDHFEFRVRADNGTHNLFDGDPNTRFVSTAVDTLVFDLGEETTITAFAMLNHNLVAGQSTCNLEGNGSNAWGSPGYQAALTITAPLVHYLNEAYQYWRTDPTDANLSLISIGELFLGTYMELQRNAWWGTAEGLGYLGYGQESAWGIRRQQGLVRQRTFTLKYDRIQGTDIDALVGMQAALWDSTTGRVRPLFVHLISDDDSETLIFAHWKNWADFSQIHINPSMRQIPDLVFQEVPITSV